MNAQFVQDGKYLDYTNPSTTTAVNPGTLVFTNGRAGVLAGTNKLAASALGSLLVKGIAKIRKKDEAIAAGLPVMWDADGNPKTGTAGTGAATSILSGAMAAADFLVGAVVKAAAAADEFVEVALNEVNPAFPAWPNRLHAAATTGTLSTNQLGTVLRVTVKDQVITLPEIATVAIGNEVIIVNDCVDATATAGLRVTPHANDGFSGFGITHAVNKHLTNTAATAQRGDYIRLLSAGDTHWQVLERKGVWARQT